ncbi:MAG: PQQ-dependent sugar dehydrogenase [bacterium]
MTGGTVIGREGGRRAATVAAVAIATVALAALVGRAPAGAGVSDYTLEDIGDFDQPVHVAEAPGAPDLLFVVEKPGVVRVLDNGVEQATPFLKMRRRVSDSGEQGLLSIAFHPNYAQNRRFFVFYVNTDSGHDLQVDQFRRSQDSELRADKSSRRKVIVIQHDQADNHNAGQLQFGPDDRLYISTGDGGPQGDPENDAQRKSSLLGKILRIRPRYQGGYTAPGTNPFVGAPGADEVFARGLRNPFRFSFDRDTDALTIGDVGGSAYEEVDYVADGGLGANFGWNDYEGSQETTFGIGQNAPGHVPPIHEYPNGLGADAVTGGYVVRDPGLPGLQGQYVFADFYDGDLLTIQVPSGAAGTPVDLQVDYPSSFGEGLDGQIYVVSLNGDVFALEQGA